MRTLVRWPIGLRREGAKPPSKNLRINSMYDGRTVKESTILLTMQPEIFYWADRGGRHVCLCQRAWPVDLSQTYRRPCQGLVLILKDGTLFNQSRWIGTTWRRYERASHEPVPTRRWPAELDRLLVAGQRPSATERPFVHALNCTLRRDFVQWPWQELLDIIGNCRRCRSCRY